MRRYIYSIGVTLGLLGAAVLAGATPAAAAASTPQAACGSGYSVLESKTVGFDKSTGNPAGRVYLLYNASNGYNCVVTMHINGYVGYGAVTEAGILVEGGSWNRDKGEYQYYAGPVYAYAANKCVKYTGGIQYYDNGIFWDSYTSGFGHCG
ncbi:MULTISPECIES: acetyltransferase [unclassified Streptomyces]|uniref:acetyltransferase n=1 Tax=unclassified Streptomyces TaxID=2593676 RepID=UPI002DD88458|nr:acetyltransferase [Streptomyces sp. NBC_01800]WSA67017.1 acetyltransferase [Streptomyces sp. NBC_01800]WSA75633.1 acetyltransferase [Streptomyces sp. NBC_01799]WTD32315.1 acetyltransferase [Streptomyces sp. NBC_01643]